MYLRLNSHFSKALCFHMVANRGQRAPKVECTPNVPECTRMYLECTSECTNRACPFSTAAAMLQPRMYSVCTQVYLECIPNVPTGLPHSRPRPPCCSIERTPNASECISSAHPNVPAGCAPSRNSIFPSGSKSGRRAANASVSTGAATGLGVHVHSVCFCTGMYLCTRTRCHRKHSRAQPVALTAH